MEHDVWNKRFVMILGIEFALQIGYYLQNPLVSNYAVYLGAAVAMAGFLSGINTLVSLAMRPITGFLTDRFAKRKMLILASTLYVICSFGCALSSHFLLIGIFRVIFGIAFAFKSVIMVALISLVVKPDRVGTAVGWYGAVQTTTSAVGPAIGSFIAAYFTYSATFAFAGGIQLIGWILALTVKLPDAAINPPKPLQGSFGSIVHQFVDQFSWSQLFYLPTLMISLVAGCTTAAFGSTNALILLVGEMRGIGLASLYFTIFALVALFSKPMAGKMLDKVGVKGVVVPCLLIGISGQLCMAFIPNLVGIILGGLLMGAGHGSAYSGIQAASVQGISKDKLGVSANSFFIGPDIGMFIGPFLGAAMLQIGGPSALFLLNVGFIATGLVLFFVMQGPRNRLLKKYAAEEAAAAEAE